MTSAITMTDFTSITHIDISFGVNPMVSDMHLMLNAIYEDSMPGHERIYTDPMGQDQVLPTAELQRMI